MNCIACGRLLTQYAASITTRDGVVGWGPKCAKRVVIRPKRARAALIEVKRSAHCADPRQADLFEALA